MMRDRRRYPRIPSKNAAVLTVHAGPGPEDLVGRVLGCTTEDISLGGVRLQVSEKIEPGSLLELRVAAVSPPGVFLLKGRAAWTHESGSPGSWFLGIDAALSEEKNLVAWRAFVQTQLPPSGTQANRSMMRDTGVMW
jgi:hypothetical protein